MIQTLSVYQAFSPGADLWLLPFEPESPLFKKINWRLGFLLHSLSGLPRLTPSPAPAPRAVLGKSPAGPEFPPPAASRKTGSLNRPGGQSQACLAPIDRVFSGKLLLCLAAPPGLYIAEGHRRWAGLGRPSLRVFLPRGMDGRRFQSGWPEKAPAGKITLCPAFS